MLADVAHVIEAARPAAARSVNAVMTITYWLIGRRIIEQEQQGAARAGYGAGCSNAWPAIFLRVSVAALPSEF
jgi:hypothetical protein